MYVYVNIKHDSILDSQSIIRFVWPEKNVFTFQTIRKGQNVSCKAFKSS